MLLFIYGTLKRVGSNHHYMVGQRFVGEARTAPKYRLFDMGGYPGMIHASDGVSIEGEVWDVDEACRVRLDILEAVEEGEYALEPAPLLAPFDRESVQCYVYRWPVTDKPDIGNIWPV